MKKQIGIVGHGNIDFTCSEAKHIEIKPEEVMIVGQGHVGKTVAHQLQSKGVESILVDSDSFMVNGVAYKPIPRATSKGFSKIASMAMALGAMGGYGFGSGYSRNLPDNVDIIQEFSRIQHKKSSLSRWERDEVVRIFYRNFQRVKSDETQSNLGTLQK
jgi:hypothetical protein